MGKGKSLCRGEKEEENLCFLLIYSSMGKPLPMEGNEE